jgi:hypothetical protein
MKFLSVCDFKRTLGSIQKLCKESIIIICEDSPEYNHIIYKYKFKDVGKCANLSD